VKAVTFDGVGGPDILHVSEVPDPVAGPREVLIDVVAAGVNRADLMQREGRYAVPADASPYLGLEVAGYIAAIGDGVTGWRVGDAVCALLAGGGYAERVVASVELLLPVPRGVDLASAAALPEVACTVWFNLVRLGRLSAGETVLIHGGGSGIGTMAIQVAVAMGARVAVTAGSGRKLERCAELGAAIAINYHYEDFVTVVRAAGGADVVLDHRNGPQLARNLAALNRNGRMIALGMEEGDLAEISLRPVLMNRLTIAGSSLRASTLAEKAGIIRDVRDNLWPLLANGRVRPVVDRILPLDEAGQAHRVVENSEHFGKVLLQVR
jgi:putative PIG3 family NAD(P)H quinone oxidoreductase